MAYGATNIMVSEVTALNHEIRNNTMKGRLKVSGAFPALAEGMKVLYSPWDNFIKQIEIYPSLVLCEETKLALGSKEPPPSL